MVRRGFGLGGLGVHGIRRPQGRGSQTGPTISQTDHEETVEQTAFSEFTAVHVVNGQVRASRRGTFVL